MSSTLLTFLIGMFVKLNSAVLLHGLSQYGIQNMILPGSTFRVFGQTTLQQCYRLCVYSSDCSSINWLSSTRDCQLNMQHVGTGSLQVSMNNVYMPVEPIQPQSHTCASRPCTVGQVCVPVVMSTSHVCLQPIPASATTTATSGPTTRVTTGMSSEQTTSPNPSTTTTPEKPTQDPTTPEETTDDPTTTTPEETTDDPTTTTPEGTTDDPTTTTPEETTDDPTTTTPEETTEDPTTTTPEETTEDPTTTTPEATTQDPTTTSPEATTTTPDTSTTLAHGTCQVEADCDIFQGTTCFGGLCTCSIGYDLDFAENVCVDLRECLSFGDNFTLFAFHAIWLHDEQDRTPYTVPECLELCLQSTTYTCKSFEMFNGGCYTQKVTWFDVPENARISNNLVDHYQRRCNW